MFKIFESACFRNDTCSKISTSRFYYRLLYQNAVEEVANTFCGVSSGSTLFALASLFRILRINTVIIIIILLLLLIIMILLLLRLLLKPFLIFQACKCCVSGRLMGDGITWLRERSALTKRFVPKIIQCAFNVS